MSRARAIEIRWRSPPDRALPFSPILVWQGDTGHAQSDMVTQVYAHILDEDRKVNAQKFEMAFYANADLRGVEQRLRAESAAAEPDSEILLKQLEAKPELMDAFTKKFVEQYGEQIMNQLAKKLIGA